MHRIAVACCAGKAAGMQLHRALSRYPDGKFDGKATASRSGVWGPEPMEHEDSMPHAKLT